MSERQRLRPLDPEFEAALDRSESVDPKRAASYFLRCESVSELAMLANGAPDKLLAMARALYPEGVPK